MIIAVRAAKMYCIDTSGIGLYKDRISVSDPYPFRDVCIVFFSEAYHVDAFTGQSH